MALNPDLEQIIREIGDKKCLGSAPLQLKADVRFESIYGEHSAGQEIKVVSGTAGTWEVEVTNQEKDFGRGTAIEFIVLNYQFGYRLQLSDRKKRDFVSIEKQSVADLELELTGRSFNHILTVYVRSGVFKIGDSFTLRIGDRQFGSVGSEVFWSAGKGAMILACNPDGEGHYYGTVGNPHIIEITAHHEPCLIRLLGPSVAKQNEAFHMTLGIFDRNGNVIQNYRGTIMIENSAAIQGLPDEYSFTPADQGIKRFDNVRIGKQGVFRISVSETICQLQGKSNPIVVDETLTTKVYWGDLHCHGWGDTTMYLMHMRTPKLDPLSRHQQACNIGRLDFSAPGPMSYPRTEREQLWEAYTEAVRKTDASGKYVPFLSYEAHPSGPIGDCNVIFKNLSEPMPPDYEVPMLEVEQRYGKREDVLMQVHIGGQTPKWDNYKTQRERLLEVSSGFGNAEWLLQKALKLGYKPAVCGCSDLHMGLLGGPRSVEPFRGRFQKVMNQRDSGYGTGPLTAVIAPQLTREHLWKAITQKSTYAISGERIFLDISCNGMMMGSEMVKKGDFILKVRCHGTEILDRIDLISGEYLIRSWYPGALDYSTELQLYSHDIPGDWLYMRVHQVDGSYAWTTPFWFHSEFARWNECIQEPDEEEAKEAAAYLDDMKRYLAQEENIELFSEIMPVRVVRQTMASCALFFGYYGDGHKISIRWFFEYDIPKIRFDWGWSDFGVKDDVVQENLLK